MLKRDRNKGAKTKSSGMKIIFEYLKSLIIAVILAFAIKTTVVEAYHIPTPSMEKTLMTGDFILGTKFLYGINIPFIDIRLPALREPQRGDLVVFRPPHDPGENYVKRCIGIPGDTVQVINKRIYINGELYHDEKFTQYVSDAILPSGTQMVDPYKNNRSNSEMLDEDIRPFPSFRDNSSPIIVPEGKYFMMGDNRDVSLDSRMWGFVDRDDILGKALITLWSWDTKDKNAPAVNWNNPLTVVHNVGYNVIHLPERMRWDRILHIPR
jgi:signal peptidase I